MVAKLEQGLVHNREDVLTALKEVGLSINRAGKDYITVKDPDSGEKLRLKGGIYAEQWQFDHAGRAHQGQDRAGCEEIENLTRKQFESLSRSLAASSKTALNTTESVIHSSIAGWEKNITSRFQSLGQTFNRKYLYAILLSAGILTATICTCWGLITLYRHQIETLRREVTELSARKTEMENTIAAWPMTVRNAPNGRFIVPTPPHTLKDKWTFDGQTAWKLE